MSNSTDNTNATTDLSQQLAELEWDIQPQRDLWPDIHSQIRFADKRKQDAARKLPMWLPAAMAASLVLAAGSILFSSKTYEQSQQVQQYQAELVRYQQAQLQLIETQHQTVRLQLSAFLNAEEQYLNPQLVAEARSLMQNIDLAAAELKHAMLSQPDNPKYTSMLVRAYQQEANLLTQISANTDESI